MRYSTVNNCLNDAHNVDMCMNVKKTEDTPCTAVLLSWVSKPK